MIYITGDCHGNFERFNASIFPEQNEMTKEDYVIICGDFGGVWNKDEESNMETIVLDWLECKPFTILFVDGNHENFDRLYGYPVEEWHGGKVHKIRPSVIHLMRGQIYELCGRKIFTFGGASSHDISGGIVELDDPELQKRNVTAMAHGSKLDGEIFSEFSRDWTNLSYQAQLIRAKLQNKDLSEVIDLGDIDVFPAGKYREQMMKTRVGQYFFRMTVLNSYENRCCVTGLKQPELLVASHIKPWKVSDERTERTNPANGLCLNALHDKAFDRGLLTLDKRYRIIVSEKLKDTEMDPETKSWFMGYSDHQIILPDKFLPGKDFIEYHNDVIFQR